MAQKLIFETGLDGSGFERGLARLGATGANSLKNFVAGAFGVYSIAQAISKTVESADELVTSSKRLDTSVEQLQILRQAAKESGVEFSNLEKAFEGFNVARDKALSGGKEGAKMMGNFGRLGVTEAMLRSQTAPTAFMGQLHATALTSNSADIIAALKQILPGLKAVGSIIPFLKTDFEALGAKMRNLGMIISTETAAELKMVKDDLGIIGTLLISFLAPAIISVIDGLMDGIGKFLHWIDSKTGTGGESKPAVSNVNWKNVGTNVAGVGQGTIGALEALLGMAFSEKLYQRGVDTLAESELKFQKTGFTGGPLDRMAEALNKSGGLGDSWDAQMMERKKALDALIEQLKHPAPPELNPPEPLKKEPKPKHQAMDRSDSLVAVGNFLGSSKGMIETLAQRQTDLLQQYLPKIEANTRPQSGGDATEYPAT